jgi:hypothetical protein
MDPSLLTSSLVLGNAILSSANLIISFSLLAYILTHNFRSQVARAFLALLSFMSIVYVGDVIVAIVVASDAVLAWLRFQWLGIAFVPAAYLQFADALLRTTGMISPKRRRGVLAAYVISAIFAGLAALTDVVVGDGNTTQWVAHLAPGPLFWAFGAFFGATTMTGLHWIRLTRRRTLTSTSKRRLTYLGLASAAPMLGVFPYLLLIITAAGSVPPNWLYLLSLAGNVAVAGMTVVMGYAVAYHGVLTPDRVIKHSMIHYLLRGPVVGIAIIALMLVVPKVEQILGLPRDIVLVFTVIVSTVTFQIAINVAKPYIDRLIYRNDREELAWIQTLDERLFTTTDLEQLLENVLTTLCDMMRVSTGFVAVRENGSLHIRVSSGPRVASETFLSEHQLPTIAGLFPESEHEDERWYPDEENLVLDSGYWLLPLRSRENGGEMLGIMGIEEDPMGPIRLEDDDVEVVGNLIYQAERALADTRLQQEIFATLQRLGPEIEELQRIRGTQHFAGSEQGAHQATASLLEHPEFSRWVKDALGHYWGGTRLSKSPLLQLGLVRDLLPENDGVPAKALRAALSEAIVRLRPSGEKSLMAPEWMIYNILELRFIKGLKTRHVAQRLAMSESDYYRKQRVAIAEAARTLGDMEREADIETT